jgi:regulator of protease activity HflC (stomatin/prohibitin superfamily)
VYNVAKTAQISVEPPAHERVKWKIRHWLNWLWDNHGGTINILGLIALFLLVYLSPLIFHFVQSGQAAVRWNRFGAGTQIDTVYLEGFHVTPPWDKWFVYDVRVQQVEPRFDVISSNGLKIGVHVSIRYRPKASLLGLLHKEVGPDYVEKIVVPEVQSLIRRVFGQYSPEEIYTTKRYLIQNSIDDALGEVGQRYIDLDDLLIKSIELPSTIEDAIESKLTEEQSYLAMQFRILREEQEARRKIIEGVGVNEFQKLISQSLTPQLLQYKSIEAAAELAKGDNSKLVVFGGGKEMPIILDTGFKADFSATGATINTNIKPVKMPRFDSEKLVDTNLFEKAKQHAFVETNNLQQYMISTNRPVAK